MVLALSTYEGCIFNYLRSICYNIEEKMLLFPMKTLIYVAALLLVGCHTYLVY